MTETERARVGQALDLLRDSLYEHVDTSMAKVYGPRWDERVADKDAERRPGGRRYAVSKEDLAVMLKVIQHERIAPWWNSETRVDPRIRSFASELLTLRNLFSHGDQCINEHVRLVDTARRLLQLLNIPIPAGLESPSPAPGDAAAATIIDGSAIKSHVYEREVAGLGERGKRLWEMFDRATALFADLTRYPHDAVSTEGQTELLGFLATTGEKVFSLLEETYLLEADGEYDSAVQKVLMHTVRNFILDSELLLATIRAHFSRLVESPTPSEPELRDDQIRMAANGSALPAQWSAKDRVARARELVELALRVDEGSAIANSAIILANDTLLSDPELQSEEAVRLFRDSSARARMLAAMNPGIYYETWVVTYLRGEGKLCNDLGRSEDAAHAFARAAEIIDRYPAADPDLVY